MIYFDIISYMTLDQRLMKYPVEKFRAEEVVAAAMRNMTTQIDGFFTRISAEYPHDNPLPLRERLAEFFSGDRFSPDRPGRVITLLPELEASFVNKPSRVFPSFELKFTNGLLIVIGGESFALRREKQNVHFWLDLDSRFSSVNALSIGRKLIPGDEPDQAINEAFKIGRIPSHMFGSTALDKIADFGSLAYSRRTQAEWARGEKNTGIYELLAEYGIINPQLDAELRRVTYQPIDVYGPVREVSYVKDNTELKKEALKPKHIRNRRDNIDEGLHALCPETVQLRDNGYFLISPTDNKHPPLAIRDKMNISQYVDPMLIFGQTLLT